MKTYSYLVGGLLTKRLTPEAHQEKLNQCGEEGWELVAVQCITLNREDYMMYYFKREENDGETEPKPRPEIFDFAT